MLFLYLNFSHYQKLIDFCKEIKVDCIILGDYIAPKNFPIDVDFTLFWKLTWLQMYFYSFSKIIYT